MARAHFVKKARKDVAGTDIKAGDAYYWWQFKGGRKQCSKKPPRASQLTQSAFWQPIYSLQEQAADRGKFDEIEGAIDNFKSELENIGSECQDKLNNMPDSLQQGSTGELLQARSDACDEIVSELDGISVPSEDEIKDELRDAYVAVSDDDPDTFDKLSAEQQAARLDTAKQEKADELWDEITTALENVSCE
jgi:hypothetical protein